MEMKKTVPMVWTDGKKVVYLQMESNMNAIMAEMTVEKTYEQYDDSYFTMTRRAIEDDASIDH